MFTNVPIPTLDIETLCSVVENFAASHEEGKPSPARARPGTAKSKK